MSNEIYVVAARMKDGMIMARMVAAPKHDTKMAAVNFAFMAPPGYEMGIQDIAVIELREPTKSELELMSNDDIDEWKESARRASTIDAVSRLRMGIGAL